MTDLNYRCRKDRIGGDESNIDGDGAGNRLRRSEGAKNGKGDSRVGDAGTISGKSVIGDVANI